MLRNNKLYGFLGKYLLAGILIVMISGCSALKSDDGLFEPEASLKEANDLIDGGHFIDAREILEEIKAKDATQKYATLARIRIADSYFEDEEYEEAAFEYENFLDTHPYHQYSSYAQYRLAMSFFYRIKTVDISYSWAKNALEEFNKLQRRYPRNPYMEITESRINTCMRILAEYEFYVGKFYFKKGSYESAILRFDALIQNYKNSKKEPDALYYMALSYDNMGQWKKAENVLETLIEKFPTIELSSEARKKMSTYNRPSLIIKK